MFIRQVVQFLSGCQSHLVGLNKLDEFSSIRSLFGRPGFARSHETKFLSQRPTGGNLPIRRRLHLKSFIKRGYSSGVVVDLQSQQAQRNKAGEDQV